MAMLSHKYLQCLVEDYDLSYVTGRNKYNKVTFHALEELKNEMRLDYWKFQLW